MRRLGVSGVWEIFVPGLGEGQRYKFEIRATRHGEILLKTDPYGFRFEQRPYELPFFQPGFAARNNLEVTW